jgi:hypothetical protein
MIPKITRGGKLTGFVMYAIGPGRFNEHTSPMVVAGHETVLAMVDKGKELTADDGLDIANILEHPRKAHGTEVTRPVKKWDEEQQKNIATGERKAAHMWQCSLSLDGSKEGPLTTEQWGDIAHDFMGRMGFIDPDGAKSSRWVAIHHGVNRNGNDHIHIIAQLVTEDGSKASTHNDFRRAQKACGELERKHGLWIVEGRAVGQGVSGDKRAEIEKAHREERPLPVRQELKRRLRAAVASSNSEAQFVQRVYSAGVLIRPRYASGGTSKVTGYSVALPPRSGENPIWYAPSKLDRNLGLTKVREQLGVPSGGDADAVPAWQEHHSAAPSSPHVYAITAERKEALFNGTASPNDVANALASAALKKELHQPAQITQLSNKVAQLSRIAVSTAMFSQMMKQTERKKDDREGWQAVLSQAARLSRVMARSRAYRNRPELAADVERISVTIDPPTAPLEQSQNAAVGVGRVGMTDVQKLMQANSPVGPKGVVRQNQMSPRQKPSRPGASDPHQLFERIRNRTERGEQR